MGGGELINATGETVDQSDMVHPIQDLAAAAATSSERLSSQVPPHLIRFSRTRVPE